MKMGETSLTKRLLKIDSRYYIYWAMVILVTIPYLTPLGLPVPISDTTREYYSIINNVNEGDHVYFGVANFASFGENGPSCIASFRLLLKKGAKVIMCGYVVESAQLIENIIATVDPESMGKKYGIDYVNFGYLPGGETAIAALANNMPNTFMADMYGTPYDEIPMMKGIEGAKDIDLIVTIEHTNPYLWFARHWTTPYGVPQIVASTAVMEAALTSYYQAGLVSAYAAGLSGGAGLELLAGYKGEGLRSIDSLSVVGLIFIGSVIGGNIQYFYTRAKERKR